MCFRERGKQIGIGFLALHESQDEFTDARKRCHSMHIARGISYRTCSGYTPPALATNERDAHATIILQCVPHLGAFAPHRARACAHESEALRIERKHFVCLAVFTAAEYERFGLVFLI